MLKYFKYDIVFTTLALIGGTIYGYMHLGGTAGSALSTLFIIIVLGLLEISLSFDNAIVNAKILKKMDKVRERRFLTWGILIAVFGMRIIFPIVLVAIFAHISPREALHLAINDAQQYGSILHDSHLVIAGFGGAFLMMVGLNFFFDQGKDIHRFKRFEHTLASVGRIKNIETVLTLGVLLSVMQFVAPAQATEFFVSGVIGIMLYIVINGIGSLFGHHDGPDTAQVVAKTGLIGFLYLEILDASFSLDGVIGAFALSTDIFVIAAGLGIGAFFIRSFTIYMVETGMLSSYRYLEHGAFYAIISLALMMIVGAIVELPDVVVGGVGLLFVFFAFMSSLKEKPKYVPRYQKVLEAVGLRKKRRRP